VFVYRAEGGAQLGLVEADRGHPRRGKLKLSLGQMGNLRPRSNDDHRQPGLAFTQGKIISKLY
jgi:hypothetical protein